MIDASLEDQIARAPAGALRAAVLEALREPGFFARFGQAAAEATMSFSEVDPTADGVPEAVLKLAAETPEGRYEIALEELDGMTDDDPVTWRLAIYTPLSEMAECSIRSETLAPGDPDLAQALYRARKLCEAHYAWLLTHDTSCDEIPDGLRF